MIEYREQEQAPSAAEWDQFASRFRDRNQFQDHAYAEFERTPSLAIYRSVLTDGPRPLAMGQGILKEAGFVRAAVLMMRGGPLYQSTGSEQADLKNLRKYLQQLIDAMTSRYRFFYINMIQHCEISVNAGILLRETGWTKPMLERAPYITYIVPISRDWDQNLMAFDAKWRNQLRQAEGLSPVFEYGNSAALIERYVRLHNVMCRIKSIGNFSLTVEGLTRMQQRLGENLQFLIGTYQGEDVCGCTVGMSGPKAYYYYAAANELGRSKYFSNALVAKLMQELGSRGIAELDLMGIDPRRNWGGYHFKKGTGGRPVEYLGEWEYASHAFLKPLINIPLYQRVIRMYRS